VGEALGLGDPNAVFEDGLARGDVDGELAEGAVAVLPTVVFLGQHLEAEIVDRLGEGRVDLECVAAERNRPGRAWHPGIGSSGAVPSWSAGPCRTMLWICPSSPHPS
jgi:hypothetical protein